MPPFYHTLILGGGAAGFFASVTAKQLLPDEAVLLLERTSTLLGKVRISGGGRCNVTHACFDPRLLVQNYPRGSRELIGPFSRFQPRDTIAWFEARSVPLKVEADGRMFPISDNSGSIIDCLMGEAQELGVEIRTKSQVEKIEKAGDHFLLTMQTGEIFECRNLCLATGSHPIGHAYAKAFGHTIQEPVPSLFTFNVPAFSLKDLAGISVEKATLSLDSLTSTGPLLITHWGFSGPAALKLSAWAARHLHEHKYQVSLSVDWLPDLKREQIVETLRKRRQDSPNQSLAAHAAFGLPKNLWRRFISDETKRVGEFSNEAFSQLADQLKCDRYGVNGKTTHKEEFVTCGGVTLSEVNFKTMESRLCPGLFFAGEILDIDAVTGGFNFQNAWTTGWLAGTAMAASSHH